MEVVAALVITMFISFFIGMLIGSTQKGINITITQPEKVIEVVKEPEKPVYNEFINNMTPEEQLYFEKTNGKIQF